MMDVVPQLETCRICAKCYLSSSPSDFLHLFQSQEDKQCELDFIRKEIDCWQLKISPNDGLPQQICSNCFQKFCTIESFRQDCVAAQNLLHKARQMTESQTQSNVTTRQQQQTTLLLPGTLLLTSTQPISQQFNITSPQSDTNTVSQETNSLIPLRENTTQILDDSLLINVVKENTVAVNDATELTNNTYELNTETSWDESKLFNEVIAQEADTTTQSSTEDYPKKNKNLNDLEELLEGSIIPKDLKRLLNKNNLIDESTAVQIEETQCVDDSTEENVSQRIANFPHACNYCYCPAKGSITHLVFESSEELSQHFFDVHDPKLPYPCPKCPKLFATMANRNKHYDAIHGIAGKANKHCAYCNKKLQVSPGTHEKSCNFIADWHCEICKNDFIKMPMHSFRAHQRSHGENQFRCDKRNHHKKTTTANKEDFMCMACNKEFKSMYDLKSHEFSTHNGKPTFLCTYCTKGYSTLAFLRRHIENAHINQTSIFGQDETTCSKCHATFQSKNKLHFHMQRTKYENGRCAPINSWAKSHKFACDQCSKYFSSKAQLEIHLESHDVKRRPFACEKCNVRCRTASDLKEHNKLAHLKKSTFECELCGEKFAYNKDLEIHKLYHAKLSFQCTFKDCETYCRNAKALQEHMRMHETVSCEYCGKLFTTKDIEAHIKLSHNNNNCELDNDNYKNVLTKPVSDFSFNQNNIFDNYAVPMNVIHETSSTVSLNQNIDNICPPFVESMENDLLDDGIIFEEPELLAEENNTIANNVDFIMSEETLGGVNDSFISSLLDPDYEIVVN